ncbi:MAG: ABC transporter permease, partial [Rhodospirillales bacterium]|nr:ABC transporter permease [Rhodospirillales bacterium]
AREADLAQGFTMQFLWIVIFVIAHRILWRRGIRRFGAVGG